MIYLMRHGMDDEDYIGGWSDLDLTSVGVEQVEAATNFIVNNKLVINKIISSDIRRAQSTAKIVNKKLKLMLDYTKYLRELDKGDYTGVLKKKLSLEEIKIINNYDIYDKYPNGESMVELYNRIKKYLEFLNKYDNVLLVTHRGVINMFYYILNNIEIDMNKEKFDVTHASIHELNLVKRKIRRIY